MKKDEKDTDYRKAAASASRRSWAALIISLTAVMFQIVRLLLLIESLSR